MTAHIAATDTVARESVLASPLSVFQVDGIQFGQCRAVLLGAEGTPQSLGCHQDWAMFTPSSGGLNDPSKSLGNPRLPA